MVGAGEPTKGFIMWCVGDQIEGRYEVQDVLGGPGRSGMGIIYGCRDRRTDEIVALKTFQEALLESNPGAADDFRREAMAWLAIEAHPHVAKARRILHIGGRPFLLLEWVSGGDLSGHLDFLRCDPARALKLALQFCDGMMHARAGGIEVHRDIKPSNCLLSAAGALKITDFGLAKVALPGLLGPLLSLPARLLPVEYRPEAPQLLAAGGAPLTQASKGTLAYMAPEQFEYARDVDVRADVYSFGIMLFEWMTGQVPFAGAHPAALHELRHSQKPPELRGDAQWYGELNAVVQTCLRPSPRERFRDFGEVRAVLAPIYELLAGLPAPAKVSAAVLEASDWCDRAGANWK